jgi:hypothetical protein
MQQMEASRIVYAIYSAACVVVAGVFIAAGHITAGHFLSENWQPRGSGTRLYFEHAAWMFVFGGIFFVLGLALSFGAWPRGRGPAA